MPAFWSSKPKAAPVNVQTAPTSNPADDPSVRTFSTTTQGTRSSEENESTLSGQTTPNPSGLDNRIPAIPSVSYAFLNHLLILKLLQSPTSTSHQTSSAGNERLTEVPPPIPSTPGVAPVGPPKGKLTVKILQARNLKLNRPDVSYPFCQANFRLHLTAFVYLRILSSFLEALWTKDHYRMQRQRHLRELLFHDLDRAVQQTYRKWESWLVQPDLQEMMEGRVIEETKLFLQQETLTGAMRLYCMSPPTTLN